MIDKAIIPLNPAWTKACLWFSFVSGVVLASTVFGQKLGLDGKNSQPVVLGTEVSWTLVASELEEKPTLGALPRTSQGVLSQQQLEVSFSPRSAKWTGRWLIKFRPQVLGEVAIPALTVHQGVGTLTTAPFSLRVIQDTQGRRHAFLEIKTQKSSYWLGERVVLDVRFGFDVRYFDQFVLQPHRRPLDVPVRIDGEWVRRFDGQPTKSPLVDSRVLKSLVFDDQLVHWREFPDEVRNGKTYGMVGQDFEFPSAKLLGRTIQGVSAGFRFAEEFQEDFIGGRIASDPRDAFVYAQDIRIKIMALPRRNVPEDFSGGVGDFELKCDLSADQVSVGDSFQLALVISSEADLSSLQEPTFVDQPGLRLQGVRRRVVEDDLIVTYDVIALSAGEYLIGPMKLSYFSPNDGARYQTVTTNPCSVIVLGKDDPTRAGAVQQRGLEAKEDRIRGFLMPEDVQTKPSREKLDFVVMVCLFLLPWAIGIVIFARVKIWERERNEPSWARSRRAYRLFKARIADRSCDLGITLIEYLSAKMEVEESQIHSKSLALNLKAMSIAGDLAEEVATFLEHATFGRYGGRAFVPERMSVEAMVKRLENAFKEKRL